ncbi:solute carrier family 23 member 1-like [Branchiostoma lanceolatum]|uniref:solute carrier family 23 member 1-like n=1 Tax=Branchiostoma lanceolatum TaxID=7740 RepID=UPI003456FC93
MADDKREKRDPEEPPPYDRPSDIMYTIEEVPPWYMCIFLGFQHYLTMFGATVSLPLILSGPLCVGSNSLATSELIQTTFFVSGLCTLLQTTFGVRLPIVQGATFAFLTPTFAILSLPGFACPTVLGSVENTSLITIQVDANTTADVDINEHWRIRIREIQGAIMVSSVFQVVIGFSGLMGLMLRFIGPLAIAPTIALVGLALFEEASSQAGKHWGIAFMTIALIAIFSQYLRNVNFPGAKWSREKGCHVAWFPLFKLFPVILGMCVSWGFCGILTAANVFPTDPNDPQHSARTDNTAVLSQAAWFRFPYPGQWGRPTISIAGVFGMLSGVLASMVESVGDYYACARLSGAPPPPVHAINRGIGIEGIGCILAGAWGSGSGTTSYSENIGAIGITKVGSRRVVQVGALMMLVLAMFGKFGALFTTIPEPIIGGMFCVMFGMIAAVGISNLQYVDMNSSRNLFIFGFSIFFGLLLPQWMKEHPNIIKTGSAEVDQIFTVLLSTSMFVGGFVGFFLDNTVPGTDEERGIAEWKRLNEASLNMKGSAKKGNKVMECYDFPFGMDVIRSCNIGRYIPFCPTFCLPPLGSGGDEEEPEVIENPEAFGREAREAPVNLAPLAEQEMTAL